MHSDVPVPTRWSVWQEAILHCMYLAEVAYGEKLEFRNAFLYHLLGSRVQRYHIDRMKMMDNAGWITAVKDGKGWKYKLTETGRAVLRDQMRSAAKGIKITRSPQF